MHVCASVCVVALCLCTTTSCYPVQVAPKMSTSHYTMAVIMYMRVSQEGGLGRGGTHVHPHSEGYIVLDIVLGRGGKREVLN